MTPSNRRNASVLLAAAFASGLCLSGCSDKHLPNAPQDEPSHAGESSTPHTHDFPAETCFICDPDKRDAGRLWCTEHARYEDRCWDCQPQLREKGRLYCEEHALYEDECFLCHPELKEPLDGNKNTMLHSPEGAPPELFCREHRVMESACGICQPQLAAQLEPGDELKVRFESPHSAEKAGVTTVSTQSANTQAHVAAMFETSYNENALAHITPLASGIVGRVLVDVGDDVLAGDVLVEIQSSGVSAAKSSFVTASVDAALKKAALEREQHLATKNISSGKEVQESEAAYTLATLAQETARQQLRNYGFTDSEVDSIAEEHDTSSILFVRAPFSGTLVARNAVPGEAAAPGSALFTLANLDEMWLKLAVPADKATALDMGAHVTATSSGELRPTLVGRLTWIAASVDPRTRMLRARAVVPNSERTLRAGTFGKALISVSDSTASVSVPKQSIQRYASQPYVFVKLEDDLYSLRRVETVDDASSGGIAVVAGLRPNEQVVATGAFTVMSEFLKSRLGAGCVDD